MSSPDGFWSLLSLTGAPLLQLLALVVAGIVLYRLRILDEPMVDRLARLVISVTLPCLILATIVTRFRPYAAGFAGWYVLPLAAVGVVMAAAAVASVMARWIVPAPRRPAFRVVCSFHNAGYLNIPIVAAIYAHGEGHGDAEGMLVLLFLFILGISPMMWSLGVRWLRADGGPPSVNRGWRVRQILSPPFVANVLAVGLCLLNLPTRVGAETLAQVLAPIRWTGDCTIPLIMLTLGGILAGLRSAQRPPMRSIVAAGGFRFVVMPLLGLAVLGGLLAHGWLPKGYAVILFLQTMMPTATGMAVAARRYGSAETSEYVNGMVFVLYLAALVVIPFWLMVWGGLFGFAVPGGS